MNVCAWPHPSACCVVCDAVTALRVENDEDLEVWYLTCCAAMQSEELALAHEQVDQACDFAQSEACPPEEAEWLPQLLEIQEEIHAASAQPHG